MKTNLYSRESILKGLDHQGDWDVIVIGGGATGLGTALDSVTRGYKTLLLEQVDYAKGTSSRSTKLAHGGVRYLAQGDIGLVREALFERGMMFQNAPHLVQNQSFVIPNYKWWEGIYYTIGLKMYDLLAGSMSIGKSHHIKKENTLERIANLKQDKLKGGVVYKDGQFDDSRLAVNVAQTCIENGATLLNHFEVTDLTENDKGKVSGVIAKDTETGISHQFTGKVIINATGVFADDILKMEKADAKKTIVPSQGVHLVFDKSFLPGDDAIMIPKTEDGRVLFVIPWHNKALVGTTDTNLESHSLEPQPLEKEIDFILKTFNNYNSKQATRKDVKSIFAGLRPLAAPKDASEKSKEISRSHKIIVSDSDLITITGGKWTTFRRMAQDAIDKVISLKKLPEKECKTKNFPLHGARPTKNTENHLYIYGSDQPKLEKLITERPELGAILDDRLPFVGAEVVWAVRYEMARTVEDVLARRVRALFLDARAAIAMAPKVAALIREELGQTQEWEDNQLSTFTKMAEKYVCK
ncbi:glycerol-3-phosphate dehydrogenase/oxidase [Flavimarina sp. Hel_I_48]|uniref:glycerol-3-phosphate dehydrogenase/oxidase n=1 Tax=Flavimarina sp. Hel_I_48 TaxID=1392488 RepID=UPI0004DF474C|nr:glycerol-3-phosphate dehydrogenase/oxidase [Flavimarina sp. Hel_I_48]